MACTRFNYDPCRTKKQLQQSTDPGRYILNVPGNGDTPCFMNDPHIISQKWGGNLRTNAINVESELKGINRNTNRDCLDKNQYQNYNVQSSAIQYPVCNSMYTEQSRAIMPAWTIRGVEKDSWLQHVHINPQNHTEIPFLNNIDTRILEKDYFERKYDCVQDVPGQGVFSSNYSNFNNP